jgi:hypothetical protein
MLTYVDTPDDFNTPFDAMQNAVLPSKRSSLYNVMPTTSSYTGTIKVKAAKKSTKPVSARIPRAPTALTPEQESAVISRYIVLADQERHLCSNASLNDGSPTSNEHEYTEMGRSHSILQTPDEINYIVTNKLEHNISHRIPFSPIIPRKRNPPFASNESPTKNQPVRSDRSNNNIKNNNKNQLDKSNTFKMSDKLTKGLPTNKRGIIETAMEKGFSNESSFPPSDRYF